MCSYFQRTEGRNPNSLPHDSPALVSDKHREGMDLMKCTSLWRTGTFSQRSGAGVQRSEHPPCACSVKGPGTHDSCLPEAESLQNAEGPSSAEAAQYEMLCPRPSSSSQEQRVVSLTHLGDAWQPWGGAGCGEPGPEDTRASSPTESPEPS